MSVTLAFTERATRDITDAFEWYEAQRFGLGDDFVIALRKTFALLQMMPDAGPVVHRDLRRVLLRTFPYAVYYRVGSDRVEIRGCLHQRRSPRVWRRRASA